MSAHTPTPWTYRAASDVEDGIIIGGENSNAALVPGYNDHPHNIANAALIVKAVNAHAALVSSLQEMIGIYWGEGDGQEPPPECIQRAQAALTKANL